MKTIRVLGVHITSHVDPLTVKLCSIVKTNKNKSIREGIVQNITLKGVNVVGCGHRGVEFVKWYNVTELVER